MAHQLTPATIRADVTELLPALPDDGADAEDLFQYGLDSVRLLSLLERWREAGADVSFVDLAERPTLEHWMTLLPSRIRRGLHV